MNQEWFEMREARRKRLNSSVWIPLRASSMLVKEGQFGHTGWKEEFYGVNSLAIPLVNRDRASHLSWQNGGLGSSQSGHIDNDGIYIPSDSYNLRNPDLLGVHLVLNQEGNGEELPQWHLHQDFVVTMRLKREGNVWVAIDEGYIEAARIEFSENNTPSLLEVRAEFLKDYLCARQMALFTTSYRSRDEVTESADYITWAKGSISDHSANNEWEGRVSEIHEGGTPYGAKTAVFHMSRTDVDEDDDIPSLGALPSDENVRSSRWESGETGRKLYRISGQLWKNEWVEPGAHSPRVRGDTPPDTIFFVTDEQGTKENGDTLEASGKWLWFRPELMMALANRRGGSLNWYTKDTGRVGCSPDYGVHFGVNKIGLINAYAKDIVRLPEWQKLIWSGFNVSPEGKVSKELLASQVHAEPANTQAPERFLRDGFEYLDKWANAKLGFSLFRDHELTEQLLITSHRFRAIDKSGFYALAKDLARLTAERIDAGSLKKLVTPPKGENWGSIKSLEKLLATKINPDKAREITGVLVGIYELRHGDSHLPGRDIDEALNLIWVDSSQIFIHQGYQMLHACVSFLFTVGNIFEEAF